MKTITISRQYGSGGRYIAALLSEKMGVPCYDSKFLPKEAERHGISQEIINEFKGKTSLLYAIGVMMSEESQDKKRLTIPEKMFHAAERDSEAPGTGRSMHFCGKMCRPDSEG